MILTAAVNYVTADGRGRGRGLGHGVGRSRDPRQVAKWEGLEVRRLAIWREERCVGLRVSRSLECLTLSTAFAPPKRPQCVEAAARLRGSLFGGAGFLAQADRGRYLPANPVDRWLLGSTSSAKANDGVVHFFRAVRFPRSAQAEPGGRLETRPSTLRLCSSLTPIFIWPPSASLHHLPPSRLQGLILSEPNGRITNCLQLAILQTAGSTSVGNGGS